MKNNYLILFLSTTLPCLPFFLPAQCGVTVNAGEDIILCDPLTPVNLNGSVDGPIFSSEWTPSAYVVDPSSLQSPVNVSQTTTFVLRVNTVDAYENIIVNPDFEQGNYGFSSDFYYSPGDLMLSGSYDVLTNPQSANDLLFACGDHTSGSGNMLATSMTYNQYEMWCQTVPVIPNTYYYLSYWGIRLDANNHVVGIFPSINGQSMYPITFPVDAPECEWQNKNGYWFSYNNTTATICFRKSKGSVALAIDDIFFGPQCNVTDTVTVFVEKVKAVAPTMYTIPCDGAEITLNAAGSSVGPHFSYQWETTDGNILSGHNTLNPVVNAPGTYTLTVNLENGIGDNCSKSTSVEVVNLNQPQVSIASPPNLSCGGNTILTGSSLPAAQSTYQWTASQGGNIVSGANNSFVNVDQPGTYSLLLTNTATGCSGEATVSIGAPVLPAVAIQPPGVLNAGNDTLTLTATVNPSNATLSWTTPNGNVVSGANTLTPQISAPGIYILTATNPTTGCKTVDSVQVSKVVNCGIIVDAGADVTLCDPFTPFNLNGSVTGSYAASSWSPSSFVAYPDNLQSPISLPQTTTFILTVRTDELLDNLVVNPDFEQGNTGFTSGFDYSPGNLTKPDVYDVLANPQGANDAYEKCGDHTTGGGNMLAANLVHNDNFSYLWCQTVNVTPHTDYYYSYWLSKLLPNSGFAGVSFRINYEPVSFAFISPGQPACEWMNKNGIWNSGDNTTAVLCFQRYKPATALALDDILFAPFCQVTDTVTVFVESVKAVVSQSVYVAPCEGFEITLSGAGSSVGPNYTYQWDTPDGNIISGQNTLHPVVNAPGTYTLIVTLNDAVGDCIKTASTQITVIDELQAGISAPATLNCYSPNVILQGLSNQTPSTYQWTASQGGNIVSGANAPTAIVNQPGEYNLLVTNASTGCTAEATVNIESAPHPVANASADPISCFSPQTVLSGAGSSGGPNINYLWSTTDGNIVSGQNSIDALANAPGTYVISVTNTLNNCATTDTTIVTTTGTSLPVSILPADNITCIQTNITLVTDSATTGMHRVYNWTAIAGGNIVSGGNSLSPVVNAPGLYILQVTDTLSACTGADTVAVTADNDAVIAIANAPISLTCVNTTVMLDATGSSGDPLLSFQWSTSDGHIVSGGDTPAPTVDAPGTYTLLLSNPANGCSASDDAQVEQNTTPPQISILPPSSLSCAVPLIILQGQNASSGDSFFYDWTAENGGHIFAGDSTLMPCVDAGGTYTLYATNLENGCTSSATVEVSTDYVEPDLSLSVSGTLNCNAASVDLLNSSMTAPALLNHQWTLPDGSEVNTGAIPNLAATEPGSYTLLLSNIQNGCTAIASATVLQHDNVTAMLDTQQDVTCFDAADGVLNVTAAGGNGVYTYLWSNDAVTPEIVNLGAGTYTVTVTDSENCSAVTSATVTEPAQLLAGVSIVPPSANGASVGSATANPQGGTAPYTYLWDNGEDTQVITDLEAGIYTVTVTDAHGCTAVQTVTLSDSGCNVSATIQAVDPLCHGAAGGQATALPDGGSAPYTYLWTTGSTEQTVTDLTAGEYSVTVTDANGCPYSGTVFISDPTLLTLVVDNTVNAVCTNSSNGSATVLASGGTGTSTIEWNNGQSGPVASGLSAGTYIATATDANGCTATATAEIQAIDQEPPLIVAGAVTIPLGPSGAVELTMQNLGATVTDNCGLAGIQIVPNEFDCFDLGEQQVAISAQDDSGNNSTETITVTFVDTQAPVLECPANIVRCHGNNIVEYPAPIAIDNCLILGGIFDLTGGLPSGSPFPQGTTNNAYSYTDASGNVGECSFQVTILSPLNVSLDALNHDIDNQNIGSIQVTVSGSMPAYSYKWIQNGQVVATTEDLNGIGMGVYTLQVTDDFGCTAVAGPYEVTSLVQTSDPDWAKNIAVFPNPSEGVVFAVLPDELIAAEVHFTAFDGTGSKVLEQQSSREKRTVLDLSDMPNGLYFLIIRAGQSQAMWKIVINR